MKFYISSSICAVLFLVQSELIAQNSLSEMDLDFEYHEVISEAVLKHAKTDTFSYELNIAYDSNYIPKFYYTHLVTPVCETGACYLVVIFVYWDLVGNYLAYDLPRKKILTKIDHQHFTDEDYEKLQTILCNPIWPLADYPIDQLIVDSTKVLVDADVDGYSGATAPFVQEKDNIKGALFTIYTLWEFTHDEAIISRLIGHTMDLIEKNKLRLASFLESDRESYWVWAIQEMKNQDISDKEEELLMGILEKCNPFLGHEILKLVDGEDPSIQSELWRIFKLSSIEKKQTIKEKLVQNELNDWLIEEISDYVAQVDNPLEKYIIKSMIK